MRRAAASRAATRFLKLHHHQGGAWMQKPWIRPPKKTRFQTIEFSDEDPGWMTDKHQIRENWVCVIIRKASCGRSPPQTFELRCRKRSSVIAPNGLLIGLLKLSTCSLNAPAALCSGASSASLRFIAVSYDSIAWLEF